MRTAAKHETVDVPASNLKKAIAQILLDEGYIKSYSVAGQRQPGRHPHHPEVSGQQADGHVRSYAAFPSPACVSTPAPTELPKVLKGLGIAIVSTSKGVMTDKKARESHIGGEVLAFVW